MPFSSARKWSAIAFDDPDQKGVYVLGAPEILASVLPLTIELKDLIQNQAQQGLRVILFAHSPDLTAIQDPERPKLPSDLIPLAILSFDDQLRPEAYETLQGFFAAGIEVKIISGDNPQTVAALAKQAGLGAEVQVISGQELAEMDENQFAQAAETFNVFGRISPDQKAKLVQKMRLAGRYVAMIGDGVNDLLSLKQANLAIAMESGSKATRGVADIVLAKRFLCGSLPKAFLEGTAHS